jgi:hypothetical protein
MIPKWILIVTTVPTAHLQPVLDAMAEAGAGIIGHYTHCSFAQPGIGRFRPDEAANPVMGDRRRVNEVEEYRVETFCEAAKVKAVVQAIRRAHPYEVPLIYLLPLLSEDDFE